MVREAAKHKAFWATGEGCLSGLTPPGGRGILGPLVAGWSSPVARRAHNPKVAGSNPAPATSKRRREAAFHSFRLVDALRERQMPSLFHVASLHRVREADAWRARGQSP